MATTNTRTIKSSGGDYTSRSAWEAGRQADLVTGDIVEKAEVYAFADTTNFTIDGWTTDSTRYWWIYVPPTERHDGKWNSAKAKLEYVPTGTFQTVFRSNEDYGIVEGDQLSLNPNGSANTGCSLVFLTAQTATTNKTIFKKCILRAIAGGTSIQGGFYTNSANPIVGFIGCIFYDFTTSAAAYCRDGGADLRFYNCTFQNGSFGLDSTGRSNVVIAKNCLFKSVTTACQGTFAAGTDYNATNNATLNYTVTGGGNTHDRVSQTFTFVDEANDDFHLASSDTGATGFGVDLSADTFYAFNFDIDDQTITGSWSIGADKYIASGTTGTITATIGSITAALTGSPTATGTISAEVGSISAALSGTPTATGTIDAVIGSISAALSGTVSVVGTIAATVGVIFANIRDSVATTLGGWWLAIRRRRRS